MWRFPIARPAACARCSRSASPCRAQSGLSSACRTATTPSTSPKTCRAFAILVPDNVIGRFPHRGRRRKPVHRTASGDNDARAQKAYAGNDLGRDAGRVQHDRAAREDVGEAVLTDRHDQRRRGPDDRLGAQSGALALDGAFQADERGQPERDEQLDEVPDTLYVAAQERPRPVSSAYSSTSQQMAVHAVGKAAITAWTSPPASNGTANVRQCGNRDNSGTDKPGRARMRLPAAMTARIDGRAATCLYW